MGTNYYLHRAAPYFARGRDVFQRIDADTGDNQLIAEAIDGEHAGHIVEAMNERAGHAPLHIGKSSSGWCFSLHVVADEGLNTLADWQRAWSEPGVKIMDEYGSPVTPDEMLAIITEREPYGGQELGVGPPPLKDIDGARYSSWGEFYARNHAMPGPHGLLRHRIGSHCVAHGDGTYDLIPGEFS